MTVCVICAVICAFCAGICVAFHCEGKSIKRLNIVKRRKYPDEKQQIANVEFQNFMNYNGDEMPDPKEVVMNGRK